MSDKQLTVAELLARSGKTQNEGTKPRRRRSLDEGGITVAELTGNIPKVDAKPAESKHSSHPIDAESEAKPDEEVKDFEPAKVKPVAPAPAPDFEESKLSTDETIVLSVVDENEPVRLTTGSFKAVSSEQARKASTAQASAPEAKETKLRDAEPATDVTPAVVLPEPETAQNSGAVVEKDDATSTFAKVEDFSAQEEAADSQELASLDEYADDKDFDATEAEDEGKISFGVVLGMALVGVVLGAAVFKIFEHLWASFSTPVVSVLGLLVTVVVFGVVHLLRTERDGLSKALAVVVTLVMTFGPALIS